MRKLIEHRAARVKLIAELRAYREQVRRGFATHPHLWRMRGLLLAYFTVRALSVRQFARLDAYVGALDELSGQVQYGGERVFCVFRPDALHVPGRQVHAS